MKILIRYQIIDSEGNEILEPFCEEASAKYMAETYFPDSQVLEVEIEYCP